MTSSEEPTNRNVDDEDEQIDEEQLEEYKEMVENLGNFPDRVKINSLSMVAEDYSDSESAAKAIYQIIRNRLLKAPREKLLPLVYAVDSILKNAKGHYVQIVEKDAENWIPAVYKQMMDTEKAKLQKVWKTWNDSRIFTPESLKAMGRSFDDNASGNALSSSTAQVAGISRTRDGTLLLPRPLREEMDNILEDMQKDVPERDKVSLERLAEVNPKLLETIKDTANENIRMVAHSSNGKTASSKKDDSGLPDFFTEIRSPTTLQQFAAWKSNTMDIFKEANAATEAIASQVAAVYEGRYTQKQALEMTQYAATASAVATFLSEVVKMMQEDEETEKSKKKVLSGSSSGFRVDPTLFTNDGIKQKNTAVVGILYEVGLPFQSSADGRRFRTQLELSKHLDALFKRAQLEKSITRSEERGWYVSEGVWQGEAEDLGAQGGADAQLTNDTTASAIDDGYDPETSTMPADENRDRCAVCGLNFKMFFDNDEGIYQYRNCREIEVLNDEVALNDSEQMLIHVTCWRALGSPDELTMDQALQDTVRH